MGILLFSFIAAITGIGVLPDGVSWRQTFGAAGLCGIGFTISLFIAGLAFDDEGLLSVSKIAILAALSCFGYLRMPGAGEIAPDKGTGEKRGRNWVRDCLSL